MSGVCYIRLERSQSNVSHHGTIYGDLVVRSFFCLPLSPKHLVLLNTRCFIFTGCTPRRSATVVCSASRSLLFTHVNPHNGRDSVNNVIPSISGHVSRLWLLPMQVIGKSSPYSISGSLPLVRWLQDQGYDVQICGYGLSSRCECVANLPFPHVGQVETALGRFRQFFHKHVFVLDHARPNIPPKTPL